MRCSTPTKYLYLETDKRKIMILRKLFWLVSILLCFGLVSISAQTSNIKMISAGVLNGRAKSLPTPEYPAAAKSVDAKGAVNIAVVVDEQGNIESASAVSGHPLLRAAAVEAARQAKFPPTQLSGNPVKVSGVIIYDFTQIEETTTGSFKVDPRPIDQTFIVDENKNVLNEKAIEFPKPETPPAALAVNADGTVFVEITVNTEGNVTSAQATSGHPLLRQAAEEAALKAKFKPMLVNGIPEVVNGNLIYNFFPVFKVGPNNTKGISHSGDAGNTLNTFDSGVVNGKAVSLPAPVYPAAARPVKATGAVNVKVVIDEEGNVIAASAISGHPLLRASAVGAAKQAVFQPTLLGGMPVKVTGIIVYNFVP